MPLPAVTLVMPVFNEEKVLPTLFARLAAFFDGHRDIARHAVLMNDGSRDASAELIRGQAAHDLRDREIQPAALSGPVASHAVTHRTISNPSVSLT